MSAAECKISIAMGYRHGFVPVFFVRFAFVAGLCAFFGAVKWRDVCTLLLVSSFCGSLPVLASLAPAGRSQPLSFLKREKWVLLSVKRSVARRIGMPVRCRSLRSSLTSGGTCLAVCALARCSLFLLSSAVVLQVCEALAQRSTRVDSRRRFPSIHPSKDDHSKALFP